MNRLQQKTDQTATELLDLLRQLSEELHAGKRQPRQVTLDSSLDRDLGLDSLARMELLQRIEARFAISLVERSFAEAETARDLLRAILSADSAKTLGTPEQVASLTAGDAEAAPESAQTLAEVLDWHMHHQPDRLHSHFYADDKQAPGLSYRQLHAGAIRVAAGLQQHDLTPGAAVAIMLPSEAGYFFAFLGVLLAGGVPVPIYPPTRKAQMEDHLRRQLVILSNCQATHLITMPEALLFGRLLRASLPDLQKLVTVDELASASVDAFIAPRLQGTDTAFLQYTSGSTGNPKGVILSHANLLTNIRSMGKVVEVNDADVIVSWLPLYHDMGLIGNWLSCLYFATPLVLMSPLDFLNRPIRWLQAIHRYRGTLSAAPNFAYEICLTRLQDEELKGLDLSSWRGAFNGAEAVSPDCIERFCKRFGRYGFKRTALMPVYGLAENTVGLAFPPLGRGPLIDSIDRELLITQGRALPVDERSERQMRVVACGQPLPGNQIRVVDRAGHELPERYEGHIQFSGPSACSGYYRNPQATRKLFADEWLNSGDLGYVADGDIYLTGRSKDLIIIAGRNIYPQELEEAVAQLKGVRKGNVVVFGATDRQTGTERLVILAETRETDPQVLADIREEINELTLQLVGIPAHDLLLALPQTVPKTSSGKIRRSAARELYQQNLLGQQQGVWRQYLQLTLIGLRGQLRRMRNSLVGISFALWSWCLFYLLAPHVYLAILLLPVSAWRWFFMRKAIRLLVRGTGTGLKVQGLENLPSTPCILVANHASYLDGYALIAALPISFSFVAKRELSGSGWLRIALKRINTEFVERFDKQQGIEDARHLGEQAGRGHSLLFFPEGTFTRVPGLQKFYLGAFVAAAAANLPVVPIAIRGTRSILRGKDKFPHRGVINVSVGSPLKTEQKMSDNNEQDLWKQAIQLRDESRRYILRYCREPDLGSG